MAIMLSQSGQPFLIAPGLMALFSQLSGGAGGAGGGTGGGTGGSGGTGTPLLSTVGTLAAWWDAGALSGIPGVSGWYGNAAFSLTDKTGNGRTLSLSTGGSNGTALPNLNGSLGGVGPIWTKNNYTVRDPYLDGAASWNASSVPVTGGALSVYLAWSRPAIKEDGNGTQVTGANGLLTINGTAVLDMTGTGGASDTVRLFPGGAAISAGTVTQHHTHSARVVISSSGIDVWLDGTKTVSAATNTLSLGGAASISLLPNSPCYLHEAGTWAYALSSAEQTALTAAAARWTVGNRAPALGMLIGQSNSANYYGNASQWLTQKIVAYLTGRPYSNLRQDFTAFSGRGIYGASGDATLFLANSGNGNPTSWNFGSDGTAFANGCAALSADDKATLNYIAWFWSESDSTRAYSEKTVYAAAMRRTFSLIRSTIGKAAAALPILVINALPFGGSDGGGQMHREVMQDLVNDSTQNVRFMLGNTADAIGQGATWNASTGVETGGNTSHRDATGLNNYAVRMAYPIARAIMASDPNVDVRTSLPTGVPSGGPTITTAHYEGTTYSGTGSILVTVAHDGGTDLLTPLRAAIGVGWVVMDGGAVATPGTLVLATACARVSATQLRITLAATLANASTATLYYGYGQMLDPATGTATVGQGNAVTDNFASVTMPAGFTVGSDIGPGYQPNMPLSTTTYGIPLT